LIAPLLFAVTFFVLLLSLLFLFLEASPKSFSASGHRLTGRGGIPPEE